MNKIAVLFFMFILGLVGCNSDVPMPKSENDEKVATPSLEVAQVLIPAGEFIRGSNKDDDPAMRQQYGFPMPLYVDEHPQKKLHLEAYKMDVYEVTNAQFKQFILSSKRMMPFAWLGNGYALTEDQLQSMSLEKLRRLGVNNFQLDMDTREMDKPALVKAMVEQQKSMDNYPIGGVSWFAAKDFCDWRGARLPSEAEWEKAARGPDGLEYPWGNEWDPAITNTGDDGEWEEGIAPVGSYPQNKSPYGVYDLSGNVWEWVADWYEPYEGSTYQSEAFGKRNRVIRGGGGGVGHYAISYFFRGATRQFSEPEMESEDVGFRCVTEP
jgi:formylglycine-generating enzyme required for sulfatase activity